MEVRVLKLGRVLPHWLTFLIAQAVRVDIMRVNPLSNVPLRMLSGRSRRAAPMSARCERFHHDILP